MYTTYVHENVINKKKYVGYTSKSVSERLHKHCLNANAGSSTNFHRALRKYGLESFKTKILGRFENKLDALASEIFWIKEYNTLESGYNMTKGGDGGFTVHPDNYDNWLIKLKERSRMEKNGNFSGLSDEFILNESVIYFKSLKDKKDFSYTQNFRRLTEKFGAPKSYSKNRFKALGGFKTAIAKTLGMTEAELNKISNSKSSKAINSLSKANIGKRWYSNDTTKEVTQSKSHPGDGWYKGRKFGYINKKT